MSSDTGAMPVEEPCIRVDGIGKTYRLYGRPTDRLWQLLRPKRQALAQDFTALQDVSFELRRGEVLGIVGINGAGKSTLLQLVTGTVHPTTGTVRTRGRIAAILELGSGFNPDFTGRENVYLNAATLGLDKAEIDARIDQIIDFAGIRSHIDQPVKTYSSGMLIRLGFSIATSVEPDILIVDEALSVGDGAFGRQSFDRIMQIKERGASILFCSHVLFHVETFCDRAIWLHRGRMQRMGKVADVLRPYQEFIDAYTADPTAEPRPAQATPHAGPLAPSVPTVPAQPAAAAATPRGAARIRSVEIRMDGRAGTELKGVSLRSSLEVDIGFASDPRLPTPTAAIVISSDSGKILGSCISHTKGVVFERQPDGSGMACVRIERVSMNKGRYRVGAYLLCERGIHAYEMVEPAGHIELEHVGGEQGAWLLDGHWGNGETQGPGT